jgi:glucosamine--fructose-6-phosphate aminotransferase (isomerizing)
MSELGVCTAGDIGGQVAAWQAVNKTLSQLRPTLIERWRDTDPAVVMFTGCGSVNYLSATAAALAGPALGIPALSAPAGALLRPSSVPFGDPAKTLLVATSRSGETSELLQAVDSFRDMGGLEVWGITTRSQSSLVSRCDLVIAEDDGFEPSVVQTRSFSSLLSLLQGTVATVAGAALPDPVALGSAGERSLDQAKALVANIDALGRYTRVLFLASGPGFGIAQEGQLLMSEMALTDSAAYHLLDFRHGPMSMVDSETLVVAILDGDATSGERAVLDDVISFGADVLALTVGNAHPVGQFCINVDPGGLGQLALFMPPLQVLAHQRATLRGLDPDVPRNLSAVVVLDGD